MRRTGRGVAYAALCAMTAMLATDARGEGIGQVMTSKSLPDATVDVIDPESGTSGGTAGSDVKIAVGDVILFRFAYTPVPDKTSRGIQHWLTEYIPANTEVVGVRIVDADGNTILPQYPGISLDGCGSGKCNTFPGATGGSIAQLHGDTGVFFSTDARTVRTPANEFITTDNGIVMNPEPNNISPSLTPLIGDTTGPWYVHNNWDWLQIQAFGTAQSPHTSGKGNTAHLYGSPVAGPLSHYLYEPTVTGTPLSPTVAYNSVTGPWQRVQYPGATIGFGSATGSNGLARMVADAANLGWDLTPANPLPSGTNAVRVALGASRTGYPGYVEVALRVTGVPIDPNHGGTGGNVDCGEIIGSDVASRSASNNGDDNSWPSYVGTTACVFLRLLFDLEVDKDLAVGGDILTYTLRGKNLSVDDETGVVARLKYDSNRQTFVSATTPPTSSGTCLDDTTKQCLIWNLGTLNPSDEYVINAQFSVGGGGHTSNVMIANYQSDDLVAPGFSTQAITIVTGIARPEIKLSNRLDPTTSFASAGSTWRISTPVSAPACSETEAGSCLFNNGTSDVTMNDLTLRLPTGWTVSGPLSIGGVNYNCSADCGTNTPVYNLSQSYAVDQARALDFTVNVPGGTVDGLYEIEANIWAGQSGFGGNFETYFRGLVTVPVGQMRTARPTLDCPVNSSSPAITGSSEANADVFVLFNMIERGDGLADASGDWSVSNYTAFGDLYGGLEVTAVAQAPGKLPSEPSAACFATATRACSDGVDNDSDGLIDFPADPGCQDLFDGDESDPPAPECSDGLDNDGLNGTDWPDDPSCASADDPTEDGVTECADDIDNDGDGLLDFDGDGSAGLIDPDCASASDPTERTLMACQDGVDNDGDNLIDFDGLGDPNLADPGCHSDFDDDEEDLAFTPVDVKARLLIVFDTSGSMNWNTCDNTFTGGDGSIECRGDDVDCATCNNSTCGNLAEDDSRLFKVKNGISDVVAGFGEVDYSLMRFHQTQRAFDCPGSNATMGSGGWQGGGEEPCGGGYNAGDLVVSFSPDNQYTMLGWMDNDDNYSGAAPAGLDWELRGSGTTPLAGSLDSARQYLVDVQADDLRVDCRPYRVILVTDGQETCGGDPPAAASALLAMGVPVNVIGFATSDQTMVDSLNDIAVAGGTGSAIVVDDEATLSTAMASIVTETILVEVCNDLDDDCDGFVDEDFEDLGDACSNGEEGVCLEDGTMVCAPSQMGTVCNAPPGTSGTEVCNNLDDDCDGKVDEGLTGCNCVPQTEICDGVDNDCDTAVDEGTLPGVGDSCGITIGECNPGNLICDNGALVCDGSSNPIDETCNLLDDDCDTFVDEYFEECYTFATGCTVGSGCQGQCETGAITCVNGAETGCAGEVGPANELCNGLDDDCDGTVDNGFPDLGMTCDNGQQGVCYQEGTVICSGDGLSTECTAPTVTPGTEICNDLDDDCDGAIDEDLGAPIGDACGGGASCSDGILACIDGEVVCDGAVGGSQEVCDAMDNDCDSLIDEEPLPGTGGQCTDPGFETQADIGECEYGENVCIAGGIVCEGYVGPKTEVCNGLDDDCDGMADDFAECPADVDLCHEGSCIKPCEPGEFPCSFGFKCEDIVDEGQFCVPNPCVGVQCPDGSVCNEDDGTCRDLCEGVMCQEGQSCKNGFCVDCFVTGCEAGETCKPNDNGIGECVTDPCAGVECQAGEFCREGDCVSTTCDPACTGGEVCLDGQCVADMCEGVSCPQGRVCRPSDGECVSVNNCEGVSCSNGQVCNPGDGTCIDDPCLGINCPTGFECTVTLDGTSACSEIKVDDGGEDIYAAGSGCACDSSGGPDSGQLIILLAVLGLLVPRRKSLLLLRRRR